MLAQSSPAAIASSAQDSTTSEQKVSSLVTLVTQFLNSEGVAANADGLAKRLESVDVVKGDGRGIVGAISAHLLEDLKVEKVKADDVLKKGQEVIGAALPGLGVNITDATKEVDGAKREAVKITDVRDFKAGLQVSRGPRAVRELSEFEDLESKL